MSAPLKMYISDEPDLPQCTSTPYHRPLNPRSHWCAPHINPQKTCFHCQNPKICFALTLFLHGPHINKIIQYFFFPRYIRSILTPPYYYRRQKFIFSFLGFGAKPYCVQGLLLTLFSGITSHSWMELDHMEGREWSH